MMHEQPSHHESSSELAASEQPGLDWHRAHEGLSRLAKSRARLDWEEGRLLLDALRSNAHLHLGFGSFGEYIERLLGHTQRATEERLRVAEALERSPGLANALRDGSLSWSAVRELTRVATASNEEAWLEVAEGRTLRQIEELVAGHGPGDMPKRTTGELRTKLRSQYATNVGAGVNKGEGSSSRSGRTSWRWRNATHSWSAIPTWAPSRRKPDRTSHPQCGAMSCGATVDDASFRAVGRAFFSIYITLCFALKAASTTGTTSLRFVARITAHCTAVSS
jgi:hypothetical protein